MNGPQSHRDTELRDHNLVTATVIGAAIAVHKALGPDLLESLYESALCIELDELTIGYTRQSSIPAYYKDRLIGRYRVDLVVQDLVLVEIKSVERSVPVFEAQLLTYMRLMNMRVGLLINFNSRLLKGGITRMAI